MLSSFRALRALLVLGSVCSPVLSLPTTAPAALSERDVGDYLFNYLYTDDHKQTLYGSLYANQKTYSAVIDNKWSNIVLHGDHAGASASVETIKIEEVSIQVWAGRETISILDETIEVEYFQNYQWPTELPHIDYNGVEWAYWGVDINNPMSSVYSYFDAKWPSDYSKWYYDMLIVDDWLNTTKKGAVDLGGIIVAGTIVDYTKMFGIPEDKVKQYGLPSLDGINSQKPIWLNPDGTFYLDQYVWANGKQMSIKSQVPKAPSDKYVGDIYTNTRWSYFPDDVVKALYGSIPGYKYYGQSTYGYYQIPCDAQVSLTFEIDGYKYEASREYLIALNPWGEQCIGSVFTKGQAVSAAPEWDIKIGFQLLSNYYYRAGIDHSSNKPYYKLLPLPTPSSSWKDYEGYSSYGGYKTESSGYGNGWNNGYSTSAGYSNGWNDHKSSSYGNGYTSSTPTYTYTTSHAWETSSSKYDNGYKSSSSYGWGHGYKSSSTDNWNHGGYSSSSSYAYTKSTPAYSSSHAWETSSSNGYGNGYKSSSSDNWNHGWSSSSTSTHAYTTSTPTYTYTTSYPVYTWSTSSTYGNGHGNGWNSEHSSSTYGNGYKSSTTDGWEHKSSTADSWNHGGYSSSSTGYYTKSTPTTHAWSTSTSYDNTYKSTSWDNGYKSSSSWDNGYKSSTTNGWEHKSSTADSWNHGGYSSSTPTYHTTSTPAYGGGYKSSSTGWNNGYSSASGYGNSYGNGYTNDAAKVAGNLAADGSDDGDGDSWKSKAHLYEIIIIVLASVLGVGVISGVIACIVKSRKPKASGPSAYRTLYDAESKTTSAPLYGAEGGSSRYADPYADKQ